ncbi:MAG: acetyl-CoA carboxylase biotin carboxyl carrier protein [Phycisphaerales bacterium]|nr:acetyl-CoA carboxylase biotin carboxyl carrier protein [Phycisphaerales bacterium]
MVDLESIKQLIDMMVSNDVMEVTMKKGDEEISLKRPGPAVAPVIHAPHPAPAPGPAPVLTSLTEAPSPPVSDDSHLIKITSPMVGKFYASPSPGAAAFVKVGSEIHPDTVVCIIEAMKVFNEIKAEVHGVVEKIYVGNEQAVEYGQPLLGLRRP